MGLLRRKRFARSAPVKKESRAVVLARPAPGALARATTRAEELRKHSRAENTRRAYKRVWRAWSAWCEARQTRAIPCVPEHLAAYLAELSDAGASVATLAQTLSIINKAHTTANHPGPRQHPAVSLTWDGIKRTRAGEKKRKAKALGPEQIRAMVATGPGTAGVRDRALLLLGFAGAFRRSELVALDVADLERDADGLRVFVRTSKTDQTGKGEVCGIPFGSDRMTCPVRAVDDWLQVSGITNGAVFRSVRRSGAVSERRLSDRDVARVVKRAAARCGVAIELLSGHSLRSGLATTAAKAGRRMDAIMRQGRWKTVSVVQGYIQEATVLGDDNAASGIGL